MKQDQGRRSECKVKGVNRCDRFEAALSRLISVWHKMGGGGAIWPKSLSRDDKFLYHDKQYISRYSNFFSFKKVLLYKNLYTNIIFIILYTNVNIKLIQSKEREKITPPHWR